MALPAVTVVIPAKDAGGTLDHQLEAMSRQTFREPWEVVVVDDGSQDATLHVLRSWIPRLPNLRVIEGSGSAGASRNAGVEAARAGLIAFCDADDVAADGWLAALTAHLKHADAVGGPCDPTTLNDPAVQRWRSPPNPTGLAPWGDYLPYALSANCAVRRDVFLALGGFAPTWPAEDTDFFWRLQEAGYRLVAAPDAVVHYRYRPDVKSHLRQQYRYGRQKPWLYRRHRAHGMPPSGFRHGAKVWALLLLGAPWQLASKDRRVRWLGQLALRAGAVAGSVAHRVLHL